MKSDYSHKCFELDIISILYEPFDSRVRRALRLSNHSLYIVISLFGLQFASNSSLILRSITWLVIFMLVLYLPFCAHRAAVNFHRKNLAVLVLYKDTVLVLYKDTVLVLYKDTILVLYKDTVLVLYKDTVLVLYKDTVFYRINCTGLTPS
jgi:hypothetical protein